MLTIIFFLLHFISIVKSQCKDCLLASCHNLIYRMPIDGDCNGVQLSVGSAFVTFDTCANKPVVPHYCAFYDVAGAMNDATNCTRNGTTYLTPWCYDYCVSTTSCLNPVVTQNPQWQTCEQLSQNYSLPCAVVSDAVLAKYVNSTNSTGGSIIPCPHYNDPVPVNNTPSELGRLYNWLECPSCDPHNFTLRAHGNVSAVKLSLVRRDDLKFSSLFPKKCSKYLGNVEIQGYASFFYFWWPFSAIWLVLFTWRRRQAPISARNLTLVYYSLITQQILFPLYLEPAIYQLTASCMGATIFGTAFGVPLLFTPIILRAWRLYYLYRWNQSKMDPKKVDWYFEHKYLLTTKSSFIALIILHAVALFVAMMVYVASPAPYKEPTVLESARCEWWIITPEVESYAASVNASLVSFYNPTGKAIGHLSTCKFCEMPVELRLGYIVISQVFLWIGVASMYSLRHLNDQYYLWKELNRLLLICIVCFPTAVPTTFDAYRIALQVTPEVNIVYLVIILAFVWNFVWTCIYPTVLTFLPENQALTREMSKKSKHSSSDGKGSNKSKTRPTTQVEKFFLKTDKKNGVNANVHNILLDPLGVVALQGFCLESFVVENVQFLIAMRDFKLMTEKNYERAREAVRIYYEFIKEGSRLELNISYAMRHRYYEIFEVNREQLALVGSGNSVTSSPVSKPRTSFIARASARVSARASGIRGLLGFGRGLIHRSPRSTEKHGEGTELGKYIERVPSVPNSPTKDDNESSPPEIPKLELEALKEINEEKHEDRARHSDPTEDLSPSAIRLHEMDKPTPETQGDGVLIVGLTTGGSIRNISPKKGDVTTDAPADPEAVSKRSSTPDLAEESDPVSKATISPAGSPASPPRQLRGLPEDDEDGLIVIRDDDKRDDEKTRVVEDQDREMEAESKKTDLQQSDSSANMLKYADITFDDVTDEIKVLINNDWNRFKKSKHWKDLVRNVASREDLAPLQRPSTGPRGHTTSSPARPSHVATDQSNSGFTFNRSNTLVNDPSASGFGSISRDLES